LRKWKLFDKADQRIIIVITLSNYGLKENH